MLLSLHILFPQFGKFLISLEKLLVLLPLLLIELIDMDLGSMVGLLLLLLNLLHKLVNFLLKTFLEFLLHIRVFFQLDRSCRYNRLKLLSRSLVLTRDVLVLSEIFLKVIEDLQLLVEGDQRIKLVLQLLLLLLEQELQFSIATMLQHRVREALLRDTAIRGRFGPMRRSKRTLWRPLLWRTSLHFIWVNVFEVLLFCLFIFRNTL